MYNPRVATHCPTCHQSVALEREVFRPFCSERCRLVDLNAWFTNQYTVPVDDGIPETDADGEQDSSTPIPPNYLI